uniref:HNH endonuclease n=1 Tax=Globodera pallida TaxID=36090 RepID=A0A183CJ06_GLOPA
MIDTIKTTARKNSLRALCERRHAQHDELRRKSCMDGRVRVSSQRNTKRVRESYVIRHVCASGWATTEMP